MKPASFIRILSLLLAIILPMGHVAGLALPSVFSDGMVLQQGEPVPVWGTAPSGETVNVRFQGQDKQAKAGADGRWQVSLDACKASASPAVMEVSSGSASLKIADVLVGEVWLCSGQSNMEFPLGHLTGKVLNPDFKGINDVLIEEMKSAKDPLLRCFDVPFSPSPLAPAASSGGKWIPSSPEGNPEFSVTAYYFGKELRKQLGVPVGLIVSSRGGTRIEAWMPEQAFGEDATMKAYREENVAKISKQISQWDPAKVDAAYRARLKDWETTRKGRKPGPPRNPDQNAQSPSTLFNGMIHPLMPYRIKGAIWYQGESNAGHNTELYRRNFQAMITSWRSLWGQGEFPFYFAQLAAFQPPSDQPKENDVWATIRDQQRLTLDLANTGMAVLIDIGDPKDIHPKNKIDAAARLALWPLRNEYGKDLPAVCGPLYKSHLIKGGKMTITFDHCGGGLMAGTKHMLEPVRKTDAPLQRFQICGADRKWKWAEAKLAGNDSVEVSHPEVPVPVEVRYAWAQNPEGANLYNKEGLPASPFSTGSK